MARGRLETEWGQTAQICALLFNLFRSADERPRQPADFNPLVIPKWVAVEMTDAEFRARAAKKLQHKEG